MREIPVTQQMAMPAQTTAKTVALMAAMIVRLFQDRESVTARDLIEAGFTGEEIADHFDAAALEATPLCTGAETHLAMTIDPPGVRRTDTWEPPANVALVENPAAVAAIVAAPADEQASEQVDQCEPLQMEPTYQGIHLDALLRAFDEYDRLLHVVHFVIGLALPATSDAIAVCTTRHASLARDVASALQHMGTGGPA